MGQILKGAGRMRVTLMVIPHKVKPLVPEWKGWRISSYGVVIREECWCDTEKGCIGERYNDEEESCKCSKKPPHTHTWVGHLGSKPIHFPKRNSRNDEITQIAEQTIKDGNL